MISDRSRVGRQGKYGLLDKTAVTGGGLEALYHCCHLAPSGIRGNGKLLHPIQQAGDVNPMLA